MSEIAELFRRQRVLSAQVVEHVAKDARDQRTAEAVEIVLESGSVLLSASTDWTLQISAGSWPKLPDWCWPPSEWEFSQLDRIGVEGFDTVVDASPLLNEVDELNGVVLGFPAGDMVVRSGAQISYEFRSS